MQRQSSERYCYRYLPIRRIASAIGAGILIMGLVACAPRTNVQGNVVDPELLSQVKPGTLNKEQVQTLLGTPSSVGTFDQNTWYYISKQTRRYAFLDPTILDQQVIEIEFDKKGMVQAVRKYGEEDGKDVQIVSRTTPTRGRTLGIMDQLWVTLLKQFATGNGVDATKQDPYGQK